MLLESIFTFFLIISLFFIVPFLLVMEFFLFFIALGLSALATIAVLFGGELAILIVFLSIILVVAYHFMKPASYKKKIEKF